MKTMRVRALNLACILLLLSSLSAAEGAPLRSGEFGLGGQYISALLAQDATARTAAALPNTPRQALDTALPISGLQHHRTARTMRPAAAHSLQLQAVTGSGL
jgi:hypothetical protein